MNLCAFVNKLYNGGFDSREAGDIVLWMAGLHHYDAVQGLAMLEDLYRERQPEEEIGDMTPVEYRNRIVYLEKVIKGLQQHMYLLKQLRDVYDEGRPQKTTRKVGVTID